MAGDDEFVVISWKNEFSLPWSRLSFRDYESTWIWLNNKENMNNIVALIMVLKCSSHTRTHSEFD